MTKVFLRTSESSYNAGDVVRGMIGFVCTEDIPVQNILLKVTGYERVQWVQKGGMRFVFTYHTYTH